MKLIWRCIRSLSPQSLFLVRMLHMLTDSAMSASGVRIEGTTFVRVKILDYHDMMPFLLPIHLIYWWNSSCTFPNCIKTYCLRRVWFCMEADILNRITHCDSYVQNYFYWPKFSYVSFVIFCEYLNYKLTWTDTVFVSFRKLRCGANCSQKSSLGRGKSGTKRASVWRVVFVMMKRTKAFRQINFSLSIKHQINDKPSTSSDIIKIHKNC